MEEVTLSGLDKVKKHFITHIMVSGIDRSYHYYATDCIGKSIILEHKSIPIKIFF